MINRGDREPILTLRDMRVSFSTPEGALEAVRGVDMRVCPGETVAVVGASGSGKSQIMMAAMGLLASNGRAEGSASYRGQELLGLQPRSLNRIRGAKITMIFQEPMTSLDPLYTVEHQICGPIRKHSGLPAKAARHRALELLRLVRIPDPERRLKSYPHELSGGQRQRVMIAMALANHPDLLIADEPTTALDVTVQAEILALLADIQKRLRMAILFITHDLRIVEAIADRVYVMQNGRVVEEGATSDIFQGPRHDYTKMLLSAEPEGRKLPVRDDSPAIFQARDVTVTFGRAGSLFAAGHALRAVQGVNLQLRRGQTVGIVGESGSGKSTLGRALLRLQQSEGQIAFRGDPLEHLSVEAMRPFRRHLQMVFQDPYGSLSPRMTVSEIITEGLLVHQPSLSRREREAAAAAALREVGLDPSMRNRFPHEFSGGQRQRIAIARAVVLKPEIIVFDEPTSALDRWIQRQIVELLRNIQRNHDLTYIFISHDLSVVRALCDHIVVMQSGRVVEEGPTQAIFENPQSKYTKRLIRAAFDLPQVLREQGARL